MSYQRCLTLVDRGIDTLIICGGATSNCIRATVFDASSWNFRTIVAREALFDRIAASHAMSLFDMERQFADVVDCDDTLSYLETPRRAGAAARLKRMTSWRISAVTYISLAQGCRSKAEPTRLQRALRTPPTEVLQLSESIGETAIRLIDEHALGHGLQLGDALIAATALEHHLPLPTGNVKRFKSIDGLTVERFDPAL